MSKMMGNAKTIYRGAGNGYDYHSARTKEKVAWKKEMSEPTHVCMHDAAKNGEPMAVACPCPRCAVRC